MTENPQTSSFDEETLVEILGRSTVPQKYLPYCQQLFSENPEADPRYDGWAPASVSHIGHHIERSACREEKDRPRPKPVPRATTFDDISVEKLWARWKEIQAKSGLGNEWQPSHGRRQLEDLIGRSDFVWLSTHENVHIEHQASDLISLLDLLSEHSLVQEVLRNMGSLMYLFVTADKGMIDSSSMFDIVQELLLAKELALRLERELYRWPSSINQDVLYLMIAADWCTANMVIKDGGWFSETNDTQMKSIKSRMNGLVTLAKRLKWPYLDEVEETSKMIDTDMVIKASLQDWLTGSQLPGSRLTNVLMMALMQCSPSIAPAKYEGLPVLWRPNICVILPKESYWRRRSAVGRVLAAVPGVTTLCGWVGPCLRPSGPEKYSEGLLVLPVRQHHGATEVLIPLTYTSRDETGTSTMPAQRTEADDAAATLAELHFSNTVDPSTSSVAATDQMGIGEGIDSTPDNAQPKVYSARRKVIEGRARTEPPAQSTDSWTLSSLRLTFDNERAHRIVTQQSGEAAGAVIQFQEAKAGITLSFQISFTPIFLAAIRCAEVHEYRQGHSFDRRHMLYKLDELDEIDVHSDIIKVLNATGYGSEAVARAWCSKVGLDAMIWKRDCGCCYGCALVDVRQVAKLGRVMIITA